MAKKISTTGAYYGERDEVIVMWIMGLPKDPSYNFYLTPEQAAILVDQLTISLQRKALEYTDK